MIQKNHPDETVINPSRIEEKSTPSGEYRCVVCGMRYSVEDYADLCCKPIAGIENLGGRRQHRWR
ncbi:MAG: hypothetical protein JW958_08155 [Candidatus Eisenbacteria bacterium]|nr:hypothetical protein [Candidatus Eisenbacteria bacterium]